MVANFFKIAWRNLIKNKAFSFINILGLSIGISVCFIILLFVENELGYDRFNKKSDRIVRVVFNSVMNGSKINEVHVMPPVARALKNDYPEIEEATRLRNYGYPRVNINGKIFTGAKMALADSNFFSVFTIPLVDGDPKTALLQPNTAVLSRTLAANYFGNENPLGKSFKLSNAADAPPVKVTGVFDAIPDDAHFHFDMFCSLVSDTDQKSNSWMSSGYYTYLVLQKGYDYKKLEAKLPATVEKYIGPQILQEMGMNLAQFRTKGNELGLALQPLTSIHLRSLTNSEIEPGGNIKYVYISGAIAIFMLLIAAINFINLSTAGASKRGKEVGIRKVMGSGKAELIRQFLLESVLITFIALLMATVLIQLALPVFNDLSGKHLHFGFNVPRLSALLALGLLAGLLAGIYPAFFLSSFKPIATLKGRLHTNTRGPGLRSGLVVFQFFISVSLITGTIIVYQQMKFIQNTRLGYDKEQLLILSDSWALHENEKIFKQELLKDPRVANVTISGYKPAGPSYNNNAMAYPEGKDNQFMKTIEYHVDERYIPTFGMQMATGRNFSADFSTDSSAMIINETAAKAFGFGDHAVGQRIVRQNSTRGKNFAFMVIGVVKDFHFRSLHEAITPLLMVLGPETGLIVKAKTKDIAGLISTMSRQWKTYHTEEPFSYAFMDDLYNKTYAAEQKTSRILNIFAVLTIFVACLGLFGLATYTAEQRAKEIGIRKVLGASVAQVTQMLSKDFLKLVLIGCVLAFPLSYWAMYKWLQDFAYRININWWVFALSAAAALFVAIATISFKAVKAALMNPVKSLKME